MVRLVEGRIVPDEEESSSGGGFFRFLVGWRVNLLGFQVPSFWASMMALFAFLRFGPSGLLVLVMVGVVSHLACNNDGSSGGGGGGWRRRRDGTPSNVRGIEDLPQPVRRS